MTQPVTSPAPARSRRRVALVATGLMLPAVAAVAVAVTVSTPDPCRAEAVPAIGASTRFGDLSQRPVAARAHLLRLAGSIRSLADDTGDDSSAGYAYHHQRRWILDTTGTPAPTGICENTPAVFAIDIRRWEAADGSGRGIDVENPPDYALTGAHPSYRSTGAEFGTETTKRTDYPAGNQRSPITAPLATEPAALAAQLAAVDPMPDGPQATLRAVDELYTSHYLHLPVRRAVLQILADIGGLTYQTGVTDRLGRTGVAAALTAAGVEYTLVFDPTTGRLLASQQRSTGAHEYLPVPPGLVRYYTLYIEQARRPALS